MKYKLPLALAFAMLLIVALPSCKKLIGLEKKKLTKQLTEVEYKWSNVENQYYRCIDIYKNIASSVIKIAENERATSNAEIIKSMQAIKHSVDSLKSVKIDPNDKAALNQYLHTHNRLREQMNSAISLAKETLPNLKGDENFQSLLLEMEGSINRIAVASHDYNIVVKEYNNTLQEYDKERAANSGFKEWYYIPERTF
ncbi:MAG: LemA family protein [Muribaculaceae bacterium]|nr:LemA family protein [Muribaculaceae bacterium]